MGSSVINRDPGSDGDLHACFLAGECYLIIELHHGDERFDIGAIGVETIDAVPEPGLLSAVVRTLIRDPIVKGGGICVGFLNLFL